jgi:hypothetical protein
MTGHERALTRLAEARHLSHTWEKVEGVPRRHVRVSPRPVVGEVTG